MASKNILYSIAFDKKMSIVRAINASKKDEYTCCHCESKLKVRRSEAWLNGKEKSKRPHFYHPSNTSNCNPETVLHFGFKTLLYQKIKFLIENKKEYLVTWACNKCYCTHKRNLLKKATDVKLEYSLETCRPDLLLFNGERPIVAIEVIVKHAPEEKTLEFYKSNKIELITFNLDSDLDFELIDNQILKPTYVSLCTHPKCERCNKPQQKKSLVIIEAKCWKCSNHMKVSLLNMNGSYPGPSEFNCEEIKIAEAKGVLLKPKFSRTAGEKYLANICPKCDAFIGEFFLFSDFYSNWEYSKEEIECGYFCHECFLYNPPEDDIDSDTNDILKIPNSISDNYNEDIVTTELNEYKRNGYKVFPIRSNLVYCPIQSIELDFFKNSSKVIDDEIVQMVLRNISLWDKKIYSGIDGKYFLGLRFKQVRIESLTTIELLKKILEIYDIPLHSKLSNCMKCENFEDIVHDCIICSAGSRIV